MNLNDAKTAKKLATIIAKLPGGKAVRSVSWRATTASHARATSSRSAGNGSVNATAIHEPGRGPSEAWRAWSNEGDRSSP